MNFDDEEKKLENHDRIEIYCTELKIQDIHTGTKVTFGLPEKVIKETIPHLKSMSDLQRITFIIGKTHFEFSKLREETID